MNTINVSPMSGYNEIAVHALAPPCGVPAVLWRRDDSNVTHVTHPQAYHVTTDGPNDVPRDRKWWQAGQGSAQHYDNKINPVWIAWWF